MSAGARGCLSDGSWPRLRAALFTGLMAACAVAAGAHARQPAAQQLLHYDIEHGVFGKIGNLTNRIERHGEATTVTSTLRILVRVAGIVLHREEADRVERWHGERLAHFRGTTTTNGTSQTVHGESRGGRFHVTTPAGTVAAPADICTSNPWSASFVTCRTILAVDTGHVEPGEVSGGGEEIIDLNGRIAVVRRYRIEAQKTRGEVWLDAAGVPAMMTTVRDDEEVVLKRAP